MKLANRYFVPFISYLLAISLILLSSPVFANRSDVEDFVNRFYTECLGRNSEPEGLNYWSNNLLDGSLYGTNVAYNFLFSPEFINRNTTNEEFVTILYRAFFDRDPENDGYSYHLNRLYSGVTRQTVANGFIYSTEFENICASYGIEPYNTNSPGSPNIVLHGSLNQTTDYFGDIEILGELRNMGGQTATFVKITFTFYDSNSNVIDIDSTYVKGSCQLFTSGGDTDTALIPGEIGAFDLTTSTDANLVSSYTYQISYRTWETTAPNTSMVINSWINTQQDYSGDLELLGTVRNAGSKELYFGRVTFIIKNANGLVIDVRSSYINGQNVYLPSMDSYTDTGLIVGGSGSFSVSTNVDFNGYDSYYYKLSWSE